MTDSTYEGDELEELRPATLLRFVDQDYSKPSPGDVRALLHLKNLTASMAADLTGVSSRTVRKWTSQTDSPNHAPIPYAAWRILLIETGIVGNADAAELPDT
jgi:hypothetical protein